jgi:hypothetical protein
MNFFQIPTQKARQLLLCQRDCEGGVPVQKLEVLSLYLGAYLVLGIVTAAAQAPASTQTTLSPAETAAIAHQIATLHSSADRGVANGWSDAKKVAELICRPVALPALRKQISGADRVFLGTDDPKTLSLESNAKLTGTGSARGAQGWQDFSFTCEIDPATAKPTVFTAVLTPSK